MSVVRRADFRPSVLVLVVDECLAFDLPEDALGVGLGLCLGILVLVHLPEEGLRVSLVSLRGLMVRNVGPVVEDAVAAVAALVHVLLRRAHCVLLHCHRSKCRSNQGISPYASHGTRISESQFWAAERPKTAGLRLLWVG